MWIGVRQRFSQFNANAQLTAAQIDDGSTKQAGVRACLNRHYWPSADEQANSMLVGSWGKRTQVRPPYDLDVLFVLPYEVYQRFEQNAGNKQSALLQEVKQVLARTYPQTDMRGDGQVVIVGFNSVIVEVAPVIRLQNGQYWICDTNEGGRYKTIDPVAELQNIEDTHVANYHHLRPIVRMAKVWQEYCNVPLRSFVIELIACDFTRRGGHPGRTVVSLREPPPSQPRFRSVLPSGSPQALRRGHGGGPRLRRGTDPTKFKQSSVLGWSKLVGQSL